MAHTKTACRQHTLAQHDLCRVTRCEHGTVHVHIGDVSLRMQAEQLGAISAALAEASARLAPRDEERPALLC